MLVLLTAAETEARFRLGVGTLLARYVPGGQMPLVGVMVFVLAGVLGWPLVFTVLDPWLSHLPYGSDPAVRGLVFGAALWVVFLLVTRPSYLGVVTLLTYGYTLFAHLVYGFTLGAVSDVLTPVPTPR